MTDGSWRSEFGIDTAAPNAFFASKAELTVQAPGASQRHILRSAFELLKLDGALCSANVPLVYFKLVKRTDTRDLAALHRKFWNHGGAPLLVVIAPNEVHVYSGLIRPAAPSNSSDIPSLVTKLDRASSATREFLTTVESGAFFRTHHRCFDPARRVDRDLLNNLEVTRQKILEISGSKLKTKVLDALLCRLVFACYLFDRKVIGQAYLRALGLKHAVHLRDVLSLHPRTKAKKYLYELFGRLGKHFNGDLFNDDLEAEARLVPASCIDPLDDFFRATDVQSGQGSFWPYDFSAIPVEAISAIYERFLKDAAKRDGAFYTPRFLAELVLDVALASSPTLMGRRYFDPACGSGIFLVGLFHRIAEEWKQANPDARNDRRAKQLREILCNSIYGVDVNPTACRITAFSLYLAYLDHLSPRDIQDLRRKGHRLPRLVHDPAADIRGPIEGNIWCDDFFSEDARYIADADLIVGNPPWGSTVLPDTTAAKWFQQPGREYPIPDNQIAAAFIWKAAHHLSTEGRVCFVLPHGTLFNLSPTALDFQRTFIKRHAVDRVLNLADFQRFLFEQAGHPAVVIAYAKHPPATLKHEIEYWAPKADWLTTRAEIIAIAPEDRSILTVDRVLSDLDGEDAPQVWKRWYWATARDRRLLDRLSLYPRLRDQVRRTTETDSRKPWIMAVGFQPLNENDDPKKAKTLRLSSKRFIEASSHDIDLFILPSDCEQLPSSQFAARRAANSQVFQAPHVLVAKGITSVAYADFDVAFQDALRGIGGPASDRELLVFLAAYLRSNAAKYYLFQTSSNWGVSRQTVHVEELLRLPFPLPGATTNTDRAWEIIKTTSDIVLTASAKSTATLVNRADIVQRASEAIEPLIYEYLDIIPSERALIEDTIETTIPSVRPTRSRQVVPTIAPSTQAQREEYAAQLCDTLNSWAKHGPFKVCAFTTASSDLGIGVAVLQKVRTGEDARNISAEIGDLVSALQRFREATKRQYSSFELLRGTKIFDRNSLYMVKPVGQRFWTKTAALNDADEIAGTVLMSAAEAVA